WPAPSQGGCRGTVGAWLAGTRCRACALEPFLPRAQQPAHHPGSSPVTADLVEKNSGQILRSFYDKCFAGQAIGARIFVEDKLLTSDGLYRDDMEVLRAKEVLEELGAPAACLDQLIESRLLHRTRRGETLRVELTHDVLTGVVRESRNERKQR